MSAYKLYLNFDGTEELPEHTFIYKSDSSSNNSVGEVLARFRTAYNDKFKRPLSADCLQLVAGGDKLLETDLQITKAVRSGSDITVLAQKAEQPSASTARSQLPEQAAASFDSARGRATDCRGTSVDLHAASTCATQSQTSTDTDICTVTRTAQQLKPTCQSVPNKCSPVIKQFLERAREAESKKYFRAACKIYEQVLKISPFHKPTLLAFAQLWLTVSRPQDAIAIAKRAVEHDPADPATHHILGKCYSECKMYNEALAEHTTALELAKQQGQSIAIQDNLQVDIVRILYAMGGAHKDAAASLIMNVLRSNDHHQRALVVYAKVATDVGMVRDAVQVLIRVLIRAPEDQDIRMTLAKCLQKPEGMAALHAELAAGGETDAAMAFLATAIKDHGAVPASNCLYRRALELKPSSPHYALNLMHGLELEQRYGEALQLALDFCKATQIKLGCKLDVADIGKHLEGLPKLSSREPFVWLQLAPWTPQWNPKCSWDAPDLLRVTPPSGALTGARSHQQATNSDAQSTIVTSSQAGTQSCQEQAQPSQKVNYSDSQLDLLALLFTVVKLMYMGGALSRCAPLVQLLDTASQASAQELHKTLVRNEAAYFGCVKQLILHYPPPPQPQVPQPKPLYLCGDSHCLSGAWNIVHLRGEACVLVPCLVTGLKIWHMRKAGVFYPKHSFLTTMANLPDGAQAIFMFGEIDCREGLTMAVDKLKYDTLEAAMDVLLDIYMGVLLELVQQRGFEIFVHPIPPVLNETRHVVMPFNQQLKQRVQTLSKAAKSSKRLHWLDFATDLLTPDGSKLNPDLQFDGTHMAPVYVQYLNAQLSIM